MSCVEDQRQCAEDQDRCAVYDDRCAEDEDRCAEDEGRCAVDEGRCAVDEGRCAVDEGRCAEDEGRCAEDEGRCVQDEERGCADDDLLPLRPEGCNVRFEDSTEWKWTKATCAGLFRALGRYYDELWFPTVVNQWCELYYQCNHTRDYWQRRDAWLAGDEQVRSAVWSEVLEQRARRDRQVQAGCTDTEVDDQRRTVDPARILEMRKTLDEANDRIVMKRMKGPELACHDKEEPTAEERARAETEAAEIALADPSEDPNWVEMRRRMRGAFAALNLARCDVSFELLAHMMVELCNYWRNLPCTEHQIEPLLERNILREIRNFRHKLFGQPVVVEPECPRRPAPEPEECPCEPEPEACPREPEPEACPREPEPNVCRRDQQPDPCRRNPDEDEAGACGGPAPAPRPKACTAKPPRPKSRVCSRGPATNKLVEARAKLTAARMKALEEKNK